MKKNLFCALLIYFLLAFGLFSPVFFTHKTFVPGDILDQNFLYPPREKKFLTLQRWDQIIYSYPTDVFFNREIKKGRIPLWNPYVFSGYPVFANGQNGFLNPFKILLNLLFNPYRAQDLFVFIHLVLTGFFTFIFLSHLGLSFYASLFGGIVWSYNGFNAGFFSKGGPVSIAPYLPLLLYAFHKSLENRLLFWSGIGALSFAMILLGRHINIAVFALFIFGIFFIIRLTESIYKGKPIKKTLFSFILITILGTGIASVQGIPTLELLFHTSLQRPEERFFTLPFPYFLELASITLFHPLFLTGAFHNTELMGRIYQSNGFSGTVSLLLAIYLLFSKKKRKEGVISFILYWLLLFTAFLTPLTKLTAYIIPWFGRMNPFKLLFPASFLLAVASSYGLDAFLKEEDFTPKILALFTGSFLLFGIAGIILIKWPFILSLPERTPWNLGIMSVLLSSTLYALLSLENRKRIKGLVFAGIITLELVPLTFILNIPVSTSLLNIKNNYLEPLKRKAGVGRVMGIEPNLSSSLEIYSPEGYESLIPDNYFFTLKGPLPPDIRIREPRKRRLTIQDISYNLAKLLGVKYLIGTDKVYIIPEDKLELLPYPVSDVKIYRVKDVLPRAFIVGRWEKVSSWQEASELIRNGYDPLNGVLLEKDVGECGGGKGEAQIIEYDIHHVKIKTRIDGCGFLLLSDTWYPGWKVYVDGREREILRAYGFLRAVKIEKGNHIIEFKYKPRSLFAGLTITLLSTILTLAIIIRKK